MPNPEIVALLKLQSAQFVGEMRKIRGDLKSFATDFRTIAGLIAAAFVTGRIGRFAKELIDTGDALSKMSQKTGLAVEFLNGLTQAGELAGVSQESLQTGIRTLNKNLLDAKNGTGEAKDELLRFGVSGQEAGRLLQQPEESLIRIVNILSKIPTASERSAVGQKLLGRAATEWLPLINQGGDALQNQIKQLHENRKITAESARKAEEFNDSITSLTFAFQGLVQSGIGPLLPALVKITETFTKLLSLDWEGFKENMRAVLSGNFTDEAQLNKLLEDRKTLTEHIAKIQTSLKNGGDRTFFGLLPTGAEAKLQAAKEQLQRLDNEIQKVQGRIKPKEKTPVVDVLPETTVTAQSRSAELGNLIEQRKAKIELIKAEEERDNIVTGRVNILREEIALLQESASIAKEIEAAEKGKRDIDPNVAITARIQKEAELTAIQNERRKLAKEEAAIEQEGLGHDEVSRSRQQQILKLQDAEKQLSQELLQQKIEALDPLRDSVLIRGRELSVIQTEITLLKEKQEVLGENHTKEIQFLEARAAAIRKTAEQLEQEALGRGIVKGASADFERDLNNKLETFRRSVRDAQAEVERGEILPNQLPETNRLRRIELIEKTIQLLSEERKAGLLSAEEFGRAFLLEDAKLRREQATTQGSFSEGWAASFRQFTQDSTGAFGLGQTVARNFATAFQSLLANQMSLAFDQLDSKTRSWKTTLDSVKGTLKQLTAQLISAVTVQAALSAVGGGGAGFGAAAIAGPRTAGGGLFPSLGFARGGSFMVGGPGGTDRTPVSFWATRGEEVTVKTPSQQRNSDGATTINIFNNSSGQVEAQERRMPGGHKTIDIVVEDIVENSIRNGRLGRTISGTWNLGRTGRRG